MLTIEDGEVLVHDTVQLEQMVDEEDNVLEEYVALNRQDSQDIVDFRRADFIDGGITFVAAYLVGAIGYILAQRLFPGQEDGIISGGPQWLNPGIIAFFVIFLFFLFILRGALLRKESLGLSRRKVAYHYLAESASEFVTQGKADVDIAWENFESAMDYIDTHGLHVAHPDAQKELSEYYQFLSEIDNKDDREGVFLDSFSKFFQEISRSILSGNHLEFEIDISEEYSEYDDQKESYLKFVFSLVSEQATGRVRMLSATIGILLIVAVTWATLGGNAAGAIGTTIGVLSPFIIQWTRQND